MKKNFFYLICIAAIYLSCSQNEISLNNDTEELNFPTKSKIYGKAVAKEINKIVKKLNEMGVNYSDADNSQEFKQRFYENLNQTLSPDLHSRTNTILQTQMSPDVFVEKYKNLTQLQIKFIERVIKECRESGTQRDFIKRLSNINKDISSSVPEIEQERLFNLTAVLYYSVNEIQNLEKQGQMLLTPYNSIPYSRLKSRNEAGGESLSAGCRKFLAAVWVIAVGEPTPVGEIVASIITVVVGGVLLYEIVTCSSDDTEKYCLDRYVNCTSEYFDGCSTCLMFCRTNGYWPPFSTHKCY